MPGVVDSWAVIKRRTEGCIVGPVVMDRVGDAVRLVHHEEPDLVRDRQQRTLEKVFVGEALGRDKEDIYLARVNLVSNLQPGLVIGRIDGDSTDTEALRGPDLVAHQGEQRRDQQRAAPLWRLLSHKAGGEEIDHALAPAGALHDEQLRPPQEQVLYRLSLPLSNLRC